VSDAPSALSFFDPARSIHGVWRAGLTLLFEGGSSVALDEGPVVTPTDSGHRATLAGRLDLEFIPITEEVPLSGTRVALCRVEGSIDGMPVECLGASTRVVNPPAWAEIDILRSVTAVFDEGHAVFAVAHRPRGADGHGAELVQATVLVAGELRAVEDARLSTVYDGAGRQRTVGLELWLPGEEFPLRASGRATAGTTLDLEGLSVNAAAFDWRMEGRNGAGSYELTVRGEAAA
jgi:hypothetical protein